MKVKEVIIKLENKNTIKIPIYNKDKAWAVLKQILKNKDYVNRVHYHGTKLTKNGLEYALTPLKHINKEQLLYNTDYYYTIGDILIILTGCVNTAKIVLMKSDIESYKDLIHFAIYNNQKEIELIDINTFITTARLIADKRMYNGGITYTLGNGVGFSMGETCALQVYL